MLEVEAKDAASLEFASAKVTKVARSRPAESGTAGSQADDRDPWASEGPGGYSYEAPF